MEKKVLAIIQGESKYHPMTDDEIAEKLGERRESVTKVRNDLAILNSRERLKANILKDIQPDVFAGRSEREIKALIQAAGYEVSRHIVRELKREPAVLDVLSMQAPGVPALERSGNEEVGLTAKSVPKDPFRRLIGHDRSLKPIIKQAKAAMLYPPKGLHTLILGETGVGKSDLAQAMFEFAKVSKILKTGSEFITFNCADYAENPELLMSQIFGYRKGAFTGAVEDKAGLVEKANNSILFLDEIHRLPPEGQEQLFYLIDKGRFRRLGETAQERKADLTIIAATTENPELTLLKTFLRRIPMVIEIPALNMRSLGERFEMIKTFTRYEAVRIQKTIVLKNDAVRALLLFDCPGNLGQLKSEIQVACARAFLNTVINERVQLELAVDDLSLRVKRGLVQLKFGRNDVDMILGVEDVVLDPDENSAKYWNDSFYGISNEIYGFIESRHEALQGMYSNSEMVNYILGNEIEKKLRHYFMKIESSRFQLNREDLSTIFGRDMVRVVEAAIQIAETRFKRDMENLSYVLAAHLTSTISRIKAGKTISNPQLGMIQKEYPEAFGVGLEIIKVVEREFGIQVPVDEAAFVTMYLRIVADDGQEENTGAVGVIVLSHGNVASGMASVANHLIGVNHAKSIEVALDEPPQNALERTRTLVQTADVGKGVLLLADMGSLTTFGKIITDMTRIPTRTIQRTDTVMVIEAVRKAILPDANLDEIADSLIQTDKYGQRALDTPGTGEKAIVTVCLTGQGGAMVIRDMLMRLLAEKLEGVEIIPLGIMNHSLKDLLLDIGRQKRILAIVGSINPGIEHLPFFNFDDMMRGNGLRLLETIVQDSTFKAPKLQTQLCLEQLISLPNLFMIDSEWSKDECLAFMAAQLEARGYVTDRYLESVHDRERMAMTYFRDGIAIPHGSQSEVIRPVIAMMKLKHKVDWGGKFVDLICLLAVNSECIDAIGRFYDLFDGTERAAEIRAASTPETVLEILLGGKFSGR